MVVFYDIESCQDETVDGVNNVYGHVPNLLIAQHLCYKCIGINHINLSCSVCCKRTRHQG